MVYFGYMTSNTGYQITQKDINTTIKFLKTQNLPHEPKNAIKYLEKKATIAHITAHQIVQDEQNGKIKKTKTK